MKKDRVAEAFRAWLVSEAWTVIDRTDGGIEAVRGPERLICGITGTTTEAGADCDTMYGQLVRRMDDPAPGVRCAVTVSTSALTAALRVPEGVRDLLRVTVYEVTEVGAVVRHYR
ncbi:hypothetical protein ACFHW2_11730 [Actinomadura sp. LOL_016]|uniref:hypothetical protein n=1 Tax=unclassified Actinomadura TaxID=2626254 RepID=UPI003A8075CF